VQVFPVVPEVLSHPNQPPKVEPALGVASNVAVVPLAKVPVHGLLVQLTLPVTFPEPAPAKVTVRTKEDPEHATFAVIEPVMIAPLEGRLPLLWLVRTVAEMLALPQAVPPGKSKPVEVMEAISGALLAHVTWFVMSFVTGG